MNCSPTGPLRIASSRRTTCCGEARLERVRPEPSTACTPEPWVRANRSTTRAPARVLPAPPKWAPTSLISISAKKLWE